MTTDELQAVADGKVVIDSTQAPQIARELIAAREFIKAARSYLSLRECAFGEECKFPEHEDSECELCESRRLLAAYDAAREAE